MSKPVGPRAEGGPMIGAVERFELAVPDAELEDLSRRLQATRWPERETDSSQGVALERLRALCGYWADGYDWRVAERRLNAIPQFRMMIDGVAIHFLHARSARPDAFPLILTHGWPGSVVEFLDVLEPLTAAGFDCVVPSLPGYGFSEKPTEPGWGVERIAHAWAALMAGLGYERYGAQGADWGTSVSASLGQLDSAHVAGIHLMPPLTPPIPGAHTAHEESALAALTAGSSDGSGYSAQQRTRPQTIGYALVDSPVGLAAWIIEKLDAWTDPRYPLSRDQVLDNLMLYWLPRTGASAARLYWESLSDVARWLEGPLLPGDIVTAPTGCTVFPYELQRPSRAWAQQRFTDIRYWSEPDRGGHFAAFEQPHLFAQEVRGSSHSSVECWASRRTAERPVGIASNGRRCHDEPHAA